MAGHEIGRDNGLGTPSAVKGRIIRRAYQRTNPAPQHGHRPQVPLNAIYNGVTWQQALATLQEPGCRCTILKRDDTIGAQKKCNCPQSGAVQKSKLNKAQVLAKAPPAKPVAANA